MTSKLEQQALKDILGSKAPTTQTSDGQEAHELVDLYDHEVAQIVTEFEKVRARWDEPLHLASGKSFETVLAQFIAEVKERFAEIGFIVSVIMAPNEDLYGMPSPTIQVEGRIESLSFDPDRQVHEVTHDVLGLGAEHSAVIDTKHATKEQLEARRKAERHIHTPTCGEDCVF